MKRVVPETVQVMALTQDGKRILGWGVATDDGEQVGHLIDTGVLAGEEWTLATTHRTMRALVYDVARSVQDAIL